MNGEIDAVIDSLKLESSKLMDLKAIIRMFAEGKSVLLPTILVKFGKAGLAKYVEERAFKEDLKDLLALTEQLHFSVFNHNQWYSVSHFSFPIIRKVEYLDYADFNGMVRTADARNAKRGWFNYVSAVVEGELALVILVTTEMMNTYGVMLHKGEMHIVRCVIPMSGVLTDKSFVLHAGFHRDYSPPEIRYKDKTYEVRVPAMLQDGDYTECVGSLNAIEYKFAELPTVKLQVSKDNSSIAVDPITEAPIARIENVPSDASSVIECSVVSEDIQYVKNCDSQAVGDTLEKLDQAKRATPIDEFYQIENEDPCYKVYVPDIEVYEDFYDYVTADGSDSTVVMNMFERYLDEYEHLVHPDQEKRIRIKYGLDTNNSVVLVKPDQRPDRGKIVQLYGLENMFYCGLVAGSPHEVADTIANRTGKRVELGLIMKMCAEGYLTYNNNTISCLKYSGSRKMRNVNERMYFYDALVGFFYYDKEYGKTDNSVAYALFDLYHKEHVGFPDASEWERFILENPGAYQLASQLFGAYEYYGCIGEGRHLCSFGGSYHNHRRLLGYHINRDDDNSLVKQKLLNFQAILKLELGMAKALEEPYQPVYFPGRLQIHEMNDRNITQMLDRYYTAKAISSEWIAGAKTLAYVCCQILEMFGMSIEEINDIAGFTESGARKENYKVQIGMPPPVI